MKVYLLKESDFDALLVAIDRDPIHGLNGGSSDALGEKEREAHKKAHRFYNYQIRCWIDNVKKMKALTLLRPWPIAIFYLKPEIRKDVENRGWKLPKKYIGQRVAIHAGSRYVNVFDEWLSVINPTPSQTLALLQDWTALSKIQGIIGTVVFTGWHLSEYSISQWVGYDKYCWQIEEPIALSKPIPCKGAQGFWTVPPDIEAEIRKREIKNV